MTVDEGMVLLKLEGPAGTELRRGAGLLEYKGQSLVACVVSRQTEQQADSFDIPENALFHSVLSMFAQRTRWQFAARVRKAVS